MEEVGATLVDREVIAPAEEYAEWSVREWRYENVIVAAIESYLMVESLRAEVRTGWRPAATWFSTL